MIDEGPPLQELLDWIAQSPRELESAHLVFEKIGSGTATREISLAAVLVSDVFLSLGLTGLSETEEAALHPATMRPQAGVKQGWRSMACSGIAARLLAHPWFRNYWKAENPEKQRENLLRFLCVELQELSQYGGYEKFVLHEEGREEMARLVLRALNLHPQGENPNQAKDRLRAVDSLERARLMEKTKAAQERAQALREALARKEAE